jgi:hypothetical protein
MVKKKVPPKRVRDGTELERQKVAYARGRFALAFYRYYHRGGRRSPLTKDADAFLGTKLGLSEGGVKNIRLGFRNLSQASAQKLKERLGTASVEIDPFILTKLGSKENQSND